MSSPKHVPLPVSPRSRQSSGTSSPDLPSPAISHRTVSRLRFNRATTSTAIRQEHVDPFHEGSTISVNQPVGSLSISPSSRDVCLASRKGLYILDLANLNNAPRFIPQGGTWQIADCQWSPHPSTSNLILSTSSQKLLVWDLAAQRCLHKSIDAHSRAITDINWHARNPDLIATVSMDAGIRGWDMRAGDRPFMRLCAWGAAGTQVKWNRQHDHILATAHGKEVFVWDNRKGSVPVVMIKAHDAKIYGIDWDRRYRHRLVTCSLDKKIKFWTVHELASSLADSSADFHTTLPAPHTPTATIATTYPVWRARNLPFGHGVLSLPQRGEKALEMFGDSQIPVQRFEGHDDVVKEFVWRTRGGDDESFEDREFQLVTWSKDRTLRVWPVGRDITERVGYQYGAPIKVLLSRKGATDMTYTKEDNDEEQKLLPPPVVNPSGIARQKMGLKDIGMTRGGGRARGMDQLEWLTKVVKNTASSESSAVPSRVGSVSRQGSRGPSGDRVNRGEWMSLKDEVISVNKLFPRPRINFEKIDLHHRRLTVSMNGPWANGDRMAFMRIHWSFPLTYPYSSDIPTFELEKNPTVSPITRRKIIGTIKQLRETNRQCLVATSSFILGSHERVGRRIVEEESDSESEKEVMSNVPMLRRTCGATFGHNGQLVCFFPKQTVLPRTQTRTHSPPISRENRSTLVKAMSALFRLENFRHRPIRRKPRFRRIEDVSQSAQPVQAGSTITIHDVSQLGNPDIHLARLYTSSYASSLEDNIAAALQAKRLDHADIFATLHGLLVHPPPLYSLHPSLNRQSDQRREREAWERGIGRKKLILDEIFTTLIMHRDVQLLAIISCILLAHVQSDPAPSFTETAIQQAPKKDYFALRRAPSFSLIRNRSRASLTPLSPSHSSYPNSAWSQMLYSSTTPNRPITSRDGSSFDASRTTVGSLDDPTPSGSMPVPAIDPRRERAQNPYAVSGSSSFRSMGSSDGQRPHPDARQLTSQAKVSFGSLSSMRRETLHPGSSAKRRVKTCVLDIDLPMDDSPPPDLLDPGLRAMGEAFKLTYADFLLRCSLFGPRTALLQSDFLDGDSTVANAAVGGIPVFVKAKSPESRVGPTGGIVCIACAAGVFRCASCNRRPRPPICTYCRLPIRGLATTCSRCSHRVHAKCFRKHFTSSTPQCPACLCHCTPSPSLAISSTNESNSFSHGIGKEAIIPAVPGDGGRLTYASLSKMLETIKEAKSRLVNEPGPVGQELPETATDSGQRQQQRTDGLLNRARLRGLTGESLLHWKG